MVQVLEGNRRKSFAEQIGLNDIAGNFGKGITQGYQKAQQQRDLEQGLSEAEQIFSNPDLTPEQKQISLFKALSESPEAAKTLGAQLAGMQKQQYKSQQNMLQDQQRYDVIKKNFGERAAELYKAAPEGGKTNFLDKLLESRQRGLDVEDLLGQQPSTQQTSGMNFREREDEPSENAPEKTAIKAIDFDKGLLPKERVKRQEERYSKNLPLYQESQKKLLGLDSERDALDMLSELSPQISGIHRLNINPSTGELLIPALASPEAQRFVKTVNDFTTKAKDSYGSRVSNFELDRFMKRLPTLANSEEGRRQIIRQMQVINDINRANELSLQEVFDEHGGIRNIDYDKAESFARKLAKPQIDLLKKQFKTIDNSLDRMYQEKIKEKKKALVPPGRVAVEKDGKLFSLPIKFLKDAKKNGYNPI